MLKVWKWKKEGQEAGSQWGQRESQGEGNGGEAKTKMAGTVDSPAGPRILESSLRRRPMQLYSWPSQL